MSLYVSKGNRLCKFLKNRGRIQLKFIFFGVPDPKKAGGGRFRAGNVGRAQANEGKSGYKDHKHARDRC